MRKISKRLGIGLIAIGLSFFGFVFVVILGAIYIRQLDEHVCPAVGEWPDYIQFNGVTYSATGEQSTTINIGAEFDVVKRSLIERPCEVDKPRDGDATFLEKGTEVYTVEGYASYFRLAVIKSNKVQVYEVTNNPQARRGSDLFDIRNRVASIEVYRTDRTGREKPRKLATISDSARVTVLVNSVLDAPVVSQPQLVSNAERTYSLVFQLDDGTSLSLFYWINLNMLQHNLRPSDEFKSIIREIVK